jgi:hypothetical protein
MLPAEEAIGTTIAAAMAIMASTTINSIIVNPC